MQKMMKCAAAVALVLAGFAVSLTVDLAPVGANPYAAPQVGSSSIVTRNGLDQLPLSRGFRVRVVANQSGLPVNVPPGVAIAITTVSARNPSDRVQFAIQLPNGSQIGRELSVPSEGFFEELKFDPPLLLVPGQQYALFGGAPGGGAAVDISGYLLMSGEY